MILADRYHWTPDQIDALDPEFIEQLAAYQTAFNELQERAREKAEREQSRKRR